MHRHRLRLRLGLVALLLTTNRAGMRQHPRLRRLDLVVLPLVVLPLVVLRHLRRSFPFPALALRHRVATRLHRVEVPLHLEAITLLLLQEDRHLKRRERLLSLLR